MQKGSKKRITIEKRWQIIGALRMKNSNFEIAEEFGVSMS